MKNFYLSEYLTWIIVASAFLGIGLAGLITQGGEPFWWIFVVPGAGYLIYLERSYTSSTKFDSESPNNDIRYMLEDDFFAFVSMEVSGTYRWSAISAVSVNREAAVLWLWRENPTPVMLLRPEFSDEVIADIIAKVKPLGARISR